MPFGYSHLKNRSKPALGVNDPAAQESAAHPSSNNNSGSAASPRASQLFANNPSGDEVRNNQQQQPQVYAQSHHQDASQAYSPPGIAPDSDYRAYANSDLPPPARSQSTRYSVGSAYQQQQQQQLAQSQQQASSSVENLAYDSRNDPRIETRKEQQLPPQAAERHKKTSFLKSFRSNKEAKSTPPQSQHNSSGLSRKISTRRAENPPAIRTPQPAASAEQQRFEHQASQGSRTQLAPQHEDIEDDVDPYQIRPGQEDIHTAPPSAISEHHQLQAIRPVQNDSDQSDFEDGRPLPVPPPHAQHPQDLLHQQHSDSSSSNNYQYQQQQHLGHSQQNLHPGTILTNDPYRQQNAETVSQLSYDSPTVDQREDQRSYHGNGHSPTSYPAPRPDFAERTNPQQVPRPTSQQNNGNMPQSGASQQSSRRESRQPPPQGSLGQGENRDARDGPPPNYSRQGFTNNQNPQPPTPGLPNQTSNAANYRGGPPQRESSQVTGGGDQGRSTPPPVASGDRTVEDNYKELLAKYKKVKGLYFDKTAQVEQLQNTLAIQRLSQSRTSLDDSEYMNRFERLDRAIVNLAFNIRKDWRTIPSWLLPSCNQEAVKTGKQEMTGVGRACITKFLVDEVFNKTFHPSLDPQLSYNLKAIERNIRRNAAPTNNQEESEGLTAKIINWRLATLEGLRDQMSSPQASENNDDFLRITTTKLCASLIQHLQEIPAGLEDVVRTVVDLAVSIAANMPLESRDIVITHPMPGDILQSGIMKVETGIPPLENPCEDASDDSKTSSIDKDDKDNDKSSSEGVGKLRKKDAKQTAGGLLGGLIGTSNSSSGGGKKPGNNDGAAADLKSKLAPGEERVRFAGFVAVEVRGRQMLMKAPVWTIG